MGTRYIVASVFWVFLGVFAIVAPDRSFAFEEAIHVFRSVEDPNQPPDLSVCAQASFTANAVLSASLYAVQERSSDAKIVNDSTRKVGTGTACVRVTSLAVGASVPIIGAFTINGQYFIGEGACVLAANTVPTPGLILAGCTMPLDAAPGILGGVATSNSVFNPFGLPGFNTGSIWTVHVYNQ